MKRPQISGRACLRTAIVFLIVAVMPGGCVFRRDTPSLDPATPQAGMLTFINALAAGDAAAVRRCLYVKPAHERFGNDMAELFAVDAHFHHVINAYFPGQDKDLFWEWFTDAELQKARHLLPQASAYIQKNVAIFTWPQPYKSEILAKGMYRENGHWKIDLELMENIDNYPPRIGSDAVPMAMMYRLHEACPVLLSVVSDVETGKLKNIDEIKHAINQRASAGEKKIQKKLALEPVNNGNPATQPK